ncbi:hypothetical protein QTP70_031352, partial [Hemibagrus guttatus]
MEHQNMMNSGEYGSGEDVVSTMADVTLDDGPQEDMKNGTAAHMRPGHGPGKDEHPLTEDTEGLKPESTSRDDFTEGTEPKAASSHEDVVSEKGEGEKRRWREREGGEEEEDGGEERIGWRGGERVEKGEEKEEVAGREGGEEEEDGEEERIGWRGRRESREGRGRKEEVGGREGGEEEEDGEGERIGWRGRRREEKERRKEEVAGKRGRRGRRGWGERENRMEREERDVVCGCSYRSTSCSLDALTPEGLSPPHSGRSSAASMDREEERLNGDMAGSVSPQQSPMPPQAPQAAPADGLGSAVLSFDSQVKTIPSEEMVGKHSPSGLQDEEEEEKQGKEDKSKVLRSDYEEELVECPATSEVRSNLDQQEEQERDVEEEEEKDEPEVVPPVHSTVISDASPQKDESFVIKPYETICQPQMTPDEAKKRGLSFDYTESELVQQGTPDRWENGSDKTPPESKSPDSCRADPGSPFSPSTAPDQTQESPLTDHQNEAQEYKPVEEQVLEVISIPTAQQEVIVPKMEPAVDTKPDDSEEDKPEKYLETSDEDLIATVEAAQSAEPVAQLEETAAAVAEVEVDAGEPSPPEPIKAPPSKTVPVKDAAIKKAKKPTTVAAATPAPKSSPKLEKVPSKDAAPVRKTSAPSKAKSGAAAADKKTPSTSKPGKARLTSTSKRASSIPVPPSKHTSTSASQSVLVCASARAASLNSKVHTVGAKESRATPGDAKTKTKPQGIGTKIP